MRNRVQAVLTALLLAVGVLAGVGAAVPSPASAAPEERWCAEGVARPCVVSLTVNGVPINEASSIDPTLELVYYVCCPDIAPFYYAKFRVSGPLRTTSVVRLVVDTGFSTFVADDGVVRHPLLANGAFVMKDLDIGADASGPDLVRITGTPVRNHTTRTSSGVVFTGRIESTPAHNEYMEADHEWNPTSNASNWSSGGDSCCAWMLAELHGRRFEADGRTLRTGYVRYALTYAQVQQALGVRNPAALRARDLQLKLNGRLASRALTFRRDPDTQRIYIGASGFTFPSRYATGVTVVLRYRYTPPAVTITRAERLEPTVARISHTLAPRTSAGAITGYRAQCFSPRHYREAPQTASGAATARRIRITGLRPDWNYSCSVRAFTRMGAGPWSKSAAVPKP